MGPQLSTRRHGSARRLRSHGPPTQSVRRNLLSFLNGQNPSEELPPGLETDWDAFSHQILLAKLRLFPPCVSELAAGTLSTVRLDELAQILQNESILTEKYFCVNFDERQEYHNETQMSESFGSLSGDSHSELFGNEIPEEGSSSHYSVDRPISTQSRGPQESGEQHPRRALILKVDVILIEKVDVAANSQTLRTFYSPYYLRDPPTTDIDPEFVLALAVGPWIFAWDGSSLCLPRRADCYRRWRSPMGESVLTQHYYYAEWNVDLRDRLVRWVRYWNTSMFYCDDQSNLSDTEKRFRGNSWHFVHDGLDTIFEGKCPTTPWLGSVLGGSVDPRLIAQVEQTGFLRFSYVPSQRFREDVRFEEILAPADVPRTFGSHIELDRFVDDIMLVENLFEKRYAEDCQQLLSFDRWLLLKWEVLKKENGHLHEEEEEKSLITPVISEDDEMFCAFGPLVFALCSFLHPFTQKPMQPPTRPEKPE